MQHAGETDDTAKYHGASGWTFAKCPALQEITLTQPDPARLSVGQALLDGAPAFCRIRVPAASYTSYCLSYAWSPYAETFAH